MENKKAGQSTREMAAARRKKSINYLMIGLVITGIFFVFSLSKENMAALGGGGIIIFLILLKVIPNFLIDKSNKETKKEKRAIRGAIAEEKVGELLEDLGEDYYVFHDVVSQFGNIDHVVFGKNVGLILIETKSHRGNITVVDGVIHVNGHIPEKDFIRQTLGNMYWLRNHVQESIGVKPWISAAIVFTNGFVKATPPVKGIKVLNKKFLKQYIFSQVKPDKTKELLWENKEQIMEILDA